MANTCNWQQYYADGHGGRVAMVAGWPWWPVAWYDRFDCISSTHSSLGAKHYISSDLSFGVFEVFEAICYQLKIAKAYNPYGLSFGLNRPMRAQCLLKQTN